MVSPPLKKMNLSKVASLPKMVLLSPKKKMNKMIKITVAKGALVGGKKKAVTPAVGAIKSTMDTTRRRVSLCKVSSRRFARSRPSAGSLVQVRSPEKTVPTVAPIFKALKMAASKGMFAKKKTPLATGTEQKSHRLYENRFFQQRLPTCTPLFTVGSAIPFFALFTVTFVLIGGLLWFSNDFATEYTFDYTQCKQYGSDVSCADIIANRTLPGTLKGPHPSPCICEERITLNQSIPWNVFLYYRIEHLYQSYLPYSESIDEQQLYGRLNGSEAACGDYTRAEDAKKTPIAPCGMIANSLFNDVISLYKLIDYKNHTYTMEVPLFVTDITWTPKYTVKNPHVPPSCPSTVDPLECAFNGTVPPPHWHGRHPWQLDPSDPSNNGYLNEHLLSWLRPAPFSPFRKLYGRVDHQQVKPVPNKVAARYFLNGQLANGTYMLKIVYNFPVAGFGGRKSVVLANMTWLGGKSNFMAGLYLLTGLICLTLLVIFFFVDRKFGRLSKEVYKFVDNHNSRLKHERTARLLEQMKKKKSTGTPVTEQGAPSSEV